MLSTLFTQRKVNWKLNQNWLTSGLYIIIYYHPFIVIGSMDICKFVFFSKRTLGSILYAT